MEKIFDREEVAAALTGRSPEGLAALQEDAFPMLRLRGPLFACAVSVSFVSTLAIGAYLTGAFRLSDGGMVAAALLTTYNMEIMKAQQGTNELRNFITGHKTTRKKDSIIIIL